MLFEHRKFEYPVSIHTGVSSKQLNVCLMLREEKADSWITSVELIRWRHGEEGKRTLGHPGEGRRAQGAQAAQAQRDGAGIRDERESREERSFGNIVSAWSFVRILYPRFLLLYWPAAAAANIGLVIFIFKEGTCDGSAWMMHIDSSVLN